MTARSGFEGLFSWLVRQGLVADGVERLLEEVCERLCRGHALALLRVNLSMPTLDPATSAFGGVWRRGRGVAMERYGHALRQQDSWRRSPFRKMIEEDLAELRCRLERAGEGDAFPVLVELREGGGTDWLAIAVGLGGGPVAGVNGAIVSWCTDRKGGFTADELALLRALTPLLALAAGRLAAGEMAGGLLAAYLGADPGRRVLAGQVERGAVTRIEAVLLLADLRGFTALADRLPGERLVADLNARLEAIVEAVAKRGGEVLKFLGDGLLATFDLAGREPARVCEAALEATAEAGLANARLDALRPAANRLRLDMALHLGRVMYGNVGAAMRLDFTVIGPAVNEVGRIEALCEPLDEPVLVSASFAAACRARLRPVGRHRLRGVAQAQELFAPTSR